MDHPTPANTATSPDAGLTRRLARGAAGTVLLNVGGSALNLALAIVLTRVLSLAGYGVVVFVTALVMLLAIPGLLGLDRLLTREVAVHDQRGDLGAARAIVAGARLTTLGTAVGIGLVSAVVALALAGGAPSEMVVAVWIGLAALPLATWNRVQQGATLGMRRIVAAQAPEMVIRPLVFIVLVWGAASLLGVPLSSSVVLVLFLASFGVAVAIGGLLLARTFAERGGPPGGLPAAFPSVRQAMPFAILGGAAVINNQAGIVLLGLLATTEQSGLYGAAARLVLLIPFALTAVNAVLSPTAARLWDAGRLDDLRRLVTLSARATLLFSLPPAIAFIMFGSWFLDLAFPPAFTAAAPALAILSLGQLVNAAMGSAGTLLTMARRERQAAMGVTGGALVTIAVSALLIPWYGVEGAAWAGALSLTTWNVWLAIMARRELGIDTTALGFHPGRRTVGADELRRPSDV